VQDAPAGLALSSGWLLVTHLYSGYVTALNVERTPVVVGSVNVEPDGNLASAIVLAPDGRRAYIPQTRTGLALVSLQYMQDWFPVVGVLDVARMAGDRDARLTISTFGEAASMPFDAAFDAAGQVLYVALAGSDAVAVVDADTHRLRVRIPVGANPRAVVAQNGRAFALNTLAGTLSVIDTQRLEVVNTVTVTTLPLDPVILRGKVLFHQAGAPVMSDGAVSCATCHFDGGADGRTWINFRSGPRNTPALGGAAALPPYNWAGDMDELHDTIEDQIRSVMLGDGLITSGLFDPTTDTVDAGRSADLDALVAYVASLEPWPSPYRQPDGALTESAQRGMRLFLSGSPNCGCHTPPLYTDLKQHNLAGAAFSLETFEAFDTPTLRGLWATAPYMHDGVAQTLEEVLTHTDPVHSVAAGLTAQQLADLVAFLLSL
jgi:YVTN family beta-propeller protein